MAIVIGLTLYKIISLIVGLILTYLGYRLFMAGVWGSAGDLEGNYGNNKLVLKSAAPGTFFALFGTIVIAITIVEGLELSAPDNIKAVLEALEQTKPKLRKNLH